MLKQPQYLDLPQRASDHSCSEILQNYFFYCYHLIITLNFTPFTLDFPFLRRLFTFVLFTFNRILYFSSYYYAIGSLTYWANNLVVISYIENCTENNTTSTCLLNLTIFQHLLIIFCFVVEFIIGFRARVLFLLKRLHSDHP